MFTKNEFIEGLNRSLKVAQRHMKIENKDRPNLRIANVETIEFDIEATMKEWATENNVNCAVVDISTLTLDDVSAIPEILSTPVKDCCYGTNCIFANNFLFAVATTNEAMAHSFSTRKTRFTFMPITKPMRAKWITPSATITEKPGRSKSLAIWQKASAIRKSA